MKPLPVNVRECRGLIGALQAYIVAGPPPLDRPDDLKAVLERAKELYDTFPPETEQ